MCAGDMAAANPWIWLACAAPTTEAVGSEQPPYLSMGAPITFPYSVQLPS